MPKTCFGGVLCVWLCLTSTALCAEVVVDMAEIDALVKTLQGDDPIAAGQAAVRLGELRASTIPALQALAVALGDDRIAEPKRPYLIPAPYTTVSFEAERALWRIGQSTVPYLAECLKANGSESARIHALNALSLIGQTASEAIPAIKATLSDRSEEIRYRAIYALFAVQEDKAAFVKSIVHCLSDSSPNVRATAIETLGKAKSSAANAVPSLVPFLDDQESFYYSITPDMLGSRPFRFAAARSLGIIGAKVEPAVINKLERMMREDKDAQVSTACAFAFARLTDDPALGIEYLNKSLVNDKDGTKIPEYAADFLRELGPVGRPCLENLKTATEHEDASVRGSAIAAIAAIAPDKAGELLIPLANDPDAFVRTDVIESLSSLPQQTDEVIQVYIDALAVDQEGVLEYSFEHTDIQSAAIDALQKLGSRAVDAIPRLKALARRTEESWIREAAEAAIAQIEDEKQSQ